MPQSISIIFVTSPSAAEAERLAHTLLEEQLAACVNIVPNITSHYRWQGAIETSSELLLIIKTAEPRFEALRTRILELHPYAVPEIIALSPSAVHQAYADWVSSETRTS